MADEEVICASPTRPENARLKMKREMLLILSLLGLLGVTIPSQAQSMQWGATGSNSFNGLLNASIIPTTTGSNGVRYGNVNGQGYDVVVITKGLAADGAAVLPWNNEPGWWFMGAASTGGGAIPYSTVEFHFYLQGTNVPIGLTGVSFSFEDAEIGERLRNFNCWDATGNEFAVSFTNRSIFTYASGAPDIYSGDSSIDSGCPSESGAQEGKWIDVNLSSMAISGFTFQAGRVNSNYGSIIMTRLGNHVPTGELLIQSGTNQNISAGPNFISTSGSAILTPASIAAALGGFAVSVATKSSISQNIVINQNVLSSSGKSLAMNANQDIRSDASCLILTSTTGNAGAIGLTADQSVVTGRLEACASTGAGGSISIDAGNNIGITSGIDSSASSLSGHGGGISLQAGNTLTVDVIRSGGGGGAARLGAPGNITLTASNSISVGAVYDDSGPDANPQATFIAPYITVGQSGTTASDIAGTLYLQKPIFTPGADIAISGTVTGVGSVVIDAGTGAASLFANAGYTGETDILSGTLALQGNSLANSDLFLENASTLLPGVVKPGGYVTMNSLAMTTTNATLGITLTSSTTYDLVEAGWVSLNGIFSLTVAPGFVPAMSGSFQVMSFGSSLGDFEEYQGLRLSDRVLQPILTESGMWLVTGPIPTGASQPLQLVPDGGIEVGTGGYYDGLTKTLQTSGGIMSATLIDGTASQPATVMMSLAATGTAGFQLQGSLGGIILDLFGTGTDKVVVQLDYNQADAIAAAGDQTNLFLVSSSGSNAVLKNTDLPGEPNNPTEIFGAYDPTTDFQLGYYGVDTVNNRVWAVVDYDDFFGLGAQNIPVPPAGPACATEPASSDMAFSATLNGQMNSNGFGTTALFESGTNSTLAGAVVSPVVWSGSTAGFVQVSCTVASLTPNTTYYFRVDALTTSGTEYGGILSFTTLSNPVISETASPDFTTGGATLNGLVNPQGIDTIIHYQYGATAGYGNSTPPQDIGSGTSSVLVSGPLVGLLPNTTYHYQLVTTSAAGTFYGPDQTFTTATLPVSIVLSKVGNPGNAPDPLTGNGEVDYAYAIGTFDVTLNQYAAFLNAVATQSDPYGLYDSGLETDENISGILQSGFPGNYTYSVIGDSGNDPVTYLSWLDAARFCNWLQNGQPATGVENAGTTESGAYLLNGDTTRGMETRQAGAQWWIPSEDEWYKAAYYDPTLDGTGGYWLYPTRSNTAPGNTAGGGANEANYWTGVFSVTQSADYESNESYLTAVGSFTNSASYYGTYDQGGDVCQWNDAVIGSSRGQRGGDWGDGAYGLQSSDRPNPYPAGNYTGFRVASVNAPTYTVNAALVTGASVTLSANVNPNGFAGPAGDPAHLYVSWQYGFAAGSYPQSTTPQPISGGTSVSVTIPESGLSTAIYHYQLVISSALGNTYGPDQVFSQEPPTVAYYTPVITGAGTGSVLSPTVNPNGLDTTVSIQYGPTSAYTGGASAPQDIGSGFAPVAVRLNLTGLAPYTPYHYRVVTSNVLGVVQGQDQAFTTGPTYRMNAAQVTGTSVTLSASVNPNGCTGPVTDPANVHVSWQYGLSAGSYGKVTAVKPIGMGTSAVPVSVTMANGGRYGLAPAIYHYQIVISSTVGNRYGPDQIFSVEPPTVAYTAPTVAGASATLSPTVNPNGLDTTVTIQFGPTTGYGTIISGTDIGSGSMPVTVNANLTGLVPETAYHYRVVTSNALGTVYGPDQIFTTPALFNTAAIFSTGDLAPGITGASFSAFGNPAINDSDYVAFQATVTGSKGSGIVAANNSGIWADIGTNGLTLMARTGTPAPDYTGNSSVGTFATLSDPVYADDNAVAFLGTLVVTGTVTKNNNTGIWATTSGMLALVARIGDNAPDPAGMVSPSGPVFSSFAQFVLPDQGGAIILANLVNARGGVTASNNQGVWAVDTSGVFRQIIRKGDVLTANGGVKTVSALSVFNAPAASAGQTRHFDANDDLACKVSFTDGSTSVFTVQSLSIPTAIVSTKTTTPGIAGGMFGVLGNPVINDLDDVAFQATITGSKGSGIVAANNSGIWADIGTNVPTLIARTGTAAPDYNGASSVGTFATLSDPVYADDDAVAFLGTLAVTGTVTKNNNTGIWATTSGMLALVARIGDNAPDSTGTVSPGGPVFASFPQFVLPDQEGVIILANLKSGTPLAPAPGGVIFTNNQGIWAAGADGFPTQIIRTGNGLTINGSAKIVSSLSIFNAPAVSTGQTRHFNRTGELIYKVTFTDKSTSLVQSVLP